MPAGAAIGAASLGSAALGYFSTQNASKLQQTADQNALQQQMAIYQQTQGNSSPYLKMGSSAATTLADLYGLGPSGPSGTSKGFDAFTQLPAYQFPYQQGLRALNFNLNAQGKQQSGAMAKETQEFGQGLASQYMMSNYVSPLQSMSNLGGQVASNLNSTSAQIGGQIGNTTMAGGQAAAAGQVGGANAITGAMNNPLLYLIARQGLGGQGGGQNNNPSSYANNSINGPVGSSQVAYPGIS